MNRNTATNPTAARLSGRVKEATGAVTGNNKLRREGRMEQTTAVLRGAVADVTDSARRLGRSLPL